MTIQELRQKKYKVRVTHKRLIRYVEKPLLVPLFEIREKLWQNLILPKGGETIIEATSTDNKEYVAVAECSLKDSYNNKIGLKIALGRLEKQMGV